MFLTKSKKSPYYQLVYEINGKRTTISTKTKIKSEAMNFLRNFKIEDKAEEKFQQISLKEFRIEYTQYCSHNKSKSYVRGSIKTTFRMLEQEFGNPIISEISIKDFDKFISSKHSKAPYSAAMVYRVAKAAFNKAIQWGYLKVNPLMSLKIPKLPKKRPVFINEDELTIILSKIINDKIRRICVFAFFTGMRISEITHLTWEGINLKEKTIVVKNTHIFTTKSKSERTIPMCDKVLEIVSIERKFCSVKNSDEFVFQKYPGVKYNEDFISRTFKMGVKRTSLNPSIHFHSLRHSFASILVSRGASLYMVKELLGHSDFATTQIYAHLQQENLRSAIDLL